MEKRIIYKTEEGGVAIIIPAPDALQTYTLEQIAEKEGYSLLNEIKLKNRRASP